MLSLKKKSKIDMFENFTIRRKNMKQRTANRMSAISPSLTLSISAKAKAMKEAGESVVSFGVGEPDLTRPKTLFRRRKRRSTTAIPNTRRHRGCLLYERRFAKN